MKRPSPTLAPAVMHERMTARLRLRHLRLIVALGGTATLHQAADAIGVSQPAATQMLREVEELLATRLFERHARGMRPSPAGRVLIDHGRAVLDSLRTAGDTLAALASGRGGLLRVGGTPAALQGLLESVIHGFERQLPDLRLEVVEDSSERLLAGLTSGALHLILVREGTPVPSGCRFEALARDHAVVAAARGHPAAARTRVRLRDLADQRWILPPPTFAVRRLFDALFEKARFKPLLHEVQTTSARLLPTLLRQAHVLAPMPRSVIGSALLEHDLMLLPLDPRLPLTLESLGAIYAPQTLGVAADTLLQALRQRRA